MRQQAGGVAHAVGGVELEQRAHRRDGAAAHRVLDARNARPGETDDQLDLAARLAAAIVQLLRGPQRGQVEGQRLVAAARDHLDLGTLGRAMVPRHQLLDPEGFAAQVEVVRPVGDAGLHHRLAAECVRAGQIEQHLGLGRHRLQRLEVVAVGHQDGRLLGHRRNQLGHQRRQLVGLPAGHRPAQRLARSAMHHRQHGLPAGESGGAEHDHVERFRGHCSFSCRGGQHSLAPSP